MIVLNVYLTPNVSTEQTSQKGKHPLHSFVSPGDGIVSFKDFLGVLTDNHRLTQYMGKELR